MLFIENLLRYILRFLLCFILVASLVGWFLLHTEKVQTALKETIAKELDELGVGVSIDRFSFALPAVVTAHKIILYIPDQPDVAADTLTVSFSLHDIFSEGLATNNILPKSVELTNVHIPSKSALGTLDATVHIAKGSEGYKALTNIFGQFEAHPFTAQAEAVYQEGKPLQVDAIHIHLLGLVARGAFTIPIDDIQHTDSFFAGLQGSLTLASDDLSAYTPFTPFPLAGKADATFKIVKGELQGVMTMKELALDHITGAPLEGVVSAKATLQGTLQKPDVTLTLHAKGIRPKDPTLASIPAANASIQAQTVDSLLQIQADFSVPNHLPIQFHAHTPFTFSLYPPTWSLDLNSPIHGELAANAELSSLLQFFPDPPTMTGDIKFIGVLKGTISDPLVSGSIQLDKGSFAIHPIGTDLQNLSANFLFNLNNREVTLTQGEAADKYGGKVALNGNLQLDIPKKCPFTLNLNLSHVTVFDQDLVKVSFDGDMALGGDFDKAMLSGKVTCHEGIITASENASNTLPLLEVNYINHPEGAPLPQAQSITPPGSLWPITLDLLVNFPKNLQIKGKDFTSLWRGDIAIKGSGTEPELYGDIKLEEGQYDFNGNPLALKKGTITFNGEIEKKTTLNVVARKEIKDVNIDIVIKGPLKNPEVNFRSNPPMPQREILSWLLFNSGSSDISPFQGSQLTESIKNLSSGKTTGPDVLTKIRTKLGIDRLEIGRCGSGASEGQMSVQVGKYLSKNVMISLNKKEVNSVSIEATLPKKFILQAQVSDEAQGQMLLKWKRDY